MEQKLVGLSKFISMEKSTQEQLIHGSWGRTSHLIITDNARVLDSLFSGASQDSPPEVQVLFLGIALPEPYSRLQEASPLSKFRCLNQNALDQLEDVVKSMVFTMIENQIDRVLLEPSGSESDFIRLVDRKLSTFYHGINNPLTVLSGNIQLLQILGETHALSSDIKKSISDIAEISERFEKELDLIVELREKVRVNLRSGSSL